MKLASCEYRHVDYTGLHARQPRRAALIHTNGGGSDKGSLFGWWEAGARGAHGESNRHIGAQIQVKKKDRPEQYVDTDLVVYHAYGASEWAVGIEAEDDDDPSTPLNDHQLTQITLILHELHVPARLLSTAAPGDGVGWHSKYEAWNQSGHNCAGSVRDHQVRHEIIPELAKLNGERTPPKRGGKRPTHVHVPGTPTWWHRVLAFPVAQHPGQHVTVRGVVYQRGHDVEKVQTRLRVPADGLYGPNTATAVRGFQHRRGLTIDGIVGPLTAAALRR